MGWGNLFSAIWGNYLTFTGMAVMLTKLGYNSEKIISAMLFLRMIIFLLAGIIGNYCSNGMEQIFQKTKKQIKYYFLAIIKSRALKRYPINGK